MAYSKGAKPRIPVKKYVRNVKTPVADVQNLIAERATQAMALRTKCVFSTASNLVVLPDSNPDPRKRWRFAWQAGPYSQLIRCQFVTAKQNDFGPTDCISRLNVYGADGTLLGSADFHYGTATNHVIDDLNYFGSSAVVVGSPFYFVEPGKDLFGEFVDVAGARMIAASVWETSLAAVPDNGFPASGFAGGTAIYDEDRKDPALAGRSLWHTGSAQLWNWTTDTDADKRHTTSTTAKNIVDNSSTTVSSSTPGAYLNLAQHSTLRRDGDVPVIVKVFAEGTGEVRLLDAAGSTAVTCSMTGDGLGWYAVADTLPDVNAKYDLHYVAATDESLNVYAVSIYHGETFEPWTAYANITATIGTTPDPLNHVGGTATTTVTVTTTGVHTHLSIVVQQISTGSYTPVDSTTDGWTNASGWVLTGTTWEATYSRAAVPAGTYLIVYTQGVFDMTTGSSGLLAQIASCGSDQVPTATLTDTGANGSGGGDGFDYTTIT